MKKLSSLLILFTLIFSSNPSHAYKKGITKRTWLAYSVFSVNGNSKDESTKKAPLVKLTFKSDGSFVEQIVGKTGDRMKLPGKWSWNKKPETANGKKCINLTFDGKSNISPNKKVYAAVNVDFEIIEIDYNFEGHDQPYTGYNSWNARIILNEILGDWKMTFSEWTDEMPNENFYLTLVDKGVYSLVSEDEQYKEDGVWSFQNNYIAFVPEGENGFMEGMFLDPAYFNAKSRDVKILLNSGNYTPCYLDEVIREDQLIGKWTYGELELEFTKSLKFKINSPRGFDQFVEKKNPFVIYRWELKDNTIWFYPQEDNSCKLCYAKAVINLYNNGRELTFNSMSYESSKWVKQF